MYWMLLSQNCLGILELHLNMVSQISSGEKEWFYSSLPHIEFYFFSTINFCCKWLLPICHKWQTLKSYNSQTENFNSKWHLITLLILYFTIWTGVSLLILLCRGIEPNFTLALWVSPNYIKCESSGRSWTIKFLRMISQIYSSLKILLWHFIINADSSFMTLLYSGHKKYKWSQEHTQAFEKQFPFYFYHNVNASRHITVFIHFKILQ